MDHFLFIIYDFKKSCLVHAYNLSGLIFLSFGVYNEATYKNHFTEEVRMLNIAIGAVVGYYVGQKYSPSELKGKAVPFVKQTVQSCMDMFKNN